MGDQIQSAPIIYFHGLPGSRRELALVDIGADELPIVPDPLDFTVFDKLGDTGGPVKVVGFSLGAFSAIKLAAARPDAVSELVLISAAAPLEGGSFLDQMAGAPVFKAAKVHAWALAALTSAQAIAAYLLPQMAVAANVR